MNRRHILKTGAASVGALIVGLPKAFGEVKYTSILGPGYVYAPHIPEFGPSYGERVKWFAYRHMKTKCGSDRYEQEGDHLIYRGTTAMNMPMRLTDLQVDILNGTAMNHTRQQGYTSAMVAAMTYQLFLNPHSSILYVTTGDKQWTEYMHVAVKQYFKNGSEGILPNIQGTTFEKFHNDVRGRTWDLILLDSDHPDDVAHFVRSGGYYQILAARKNTQTRIITGRFPKKWTQYA